MDEMREQQTWDAWDSVSQTTKAVFNSQLWGISNAGDVRSVVLKKQREMAIAEIDDYLERGLDDLEAYANGSLQASTTALFEWSAPDGCPVDDVAGILQANPSIGHGEITVAACLADSRSMPESSYRTEVLCQWVTSLVSSFINIKDWSPLIRPVDDVSAMIPRRGRTVWGVDTSWDRSQSWVGAAVRTDSGKPFVTVRFRRGGMLWVPDYLERLADESGHREVVLQGAGSPSMEFTDPLKDRGLIVHALTGGPFAIATGRIRDRVTEGGLILIDQPDVNLAVEGGVVTEYAENLAWSRRKSKPVDIGGLVAMTDALYGLEVLDPPVVKKTAPPPAARIITRHDAGGSTEVNLAYAKF